MEPPRRRSRAPDRRDYGDDRIGSDRDGGQQRGQADAAAADDRHAISRPHAGSAPDRSRARRHRAADERRHLERDVVGDRDARALGHDARALEMFDVIGIVELTALTGYYSMVAMTLNAHDIPLPPGTVPPLPAR